MGSNRYTPSSCTELLQRRQGCRERKTVAATTISCPICKTTMIIPDFVIDEVRVCCPKCARKFSLDVSNDGKMVKGRKGDTSSSHRTGPAPLYAPNGVTITDEGESWIITSTAYRERCTYRYRGVRFSKAKWHDSDNAMRAFLKEYGTKQQRTEYAASGRQCPDTWKADDNSQKPTVVLPKPSSLLPTIRLPRPPSLAPKATPQSSKPQVIKNPTEAQKDELANIVSEVLGECGIKGASFSEDDENPFAFYVSILGDGDERLVVYACNKLFHRLRLMPQDKGLMIGQLGDYCSIVSDGDGNDKCYVAALNHPVVTGLKENAPQARFILKNWRDWDGEE